jgi:hypothetical protein
LISFFNWPFWRASTTIVPPDRPSIQRTAVNAL